jgi:hypothetical protein
MMELDDLSFVLIAIAVFLITLNIAMWLSSCDTTPSTSAAAKAAAAKNLKEKYVKQPQHQYTYYSQGDINRCGCQGPQISPTYGWSEKGMSQSRFNPGVGI